MGLPLTNSRTYSTDRKLQKAKILEDNLDAILDELAPNDKTSQAVLNNAVIALNENTEDYVRQNAWVSELKKRLASEQKKGKKAKIQEELSTAEDILDGEESICISGIDGFYRNAAHLKQWAEGLGFKHMDSVDISRDTRKIRATAQPSASGSRSRR